MQKHLALIFTALSLSVSASAQSIDGYGRSDGVFWWDLKTSNGNGDIVESEAGLTQEDCLTNWNGNLALANYGGAQCTFAVEDTETDAFGITSTGDLVAECPINESESNWATIAVSDVFTTYGTTAVACGTITTTLEVMMTTPAASYAETTHEP